MARNVEDVALLLDAMSGEHPGDPLVAARAADFVPRRPRVPASKPKRIAYSPDLGITPVDPEVAAITRKAAQRFAEAGAIVEEAHPDLREAHECFHVLRAFDFALSKAALLRTKRDLLKPEVIWNIEEGLKLTVEQLERAEAQRVAMTARTLEFFDKYDLLLCPATIVPPFPVENRYVAECAGKKFDNYVEWLGIVYAITLVCCPALSLPCGFTASGLPVGLQMVAAAARRGASCWPAPRCWRIFWACAARRRSIRGRRSRAPADRSEGTRRSLPSLPVLFGRGELIRDKGIANRPWRPVMTDQAIKPAGDHLDIQDVERRIKAIFIGSIGNLVEWYDFYAYTAFALYFAPAFFPNSDPVVQQLNAAVLFAATFLMRPLGGWLFGYIADRYGRRLSLTLSVICMCFGSLIIAVTPTYATIGIAAPAILALARIIEGLSLGGEYGASATYLSEVADPRHRGFYSSFQYVTLIGGQLTAIIVLLLLQKVFLDAGGAEGLGLADPVRDRRAARDLCRGHAA